MCQFDAELEYVIALHENTNEIHVIRLKYDENNLLSKIKDYKKVDKDDILTKLEGLVQVDCQYLDTYKGVNTYVIGIAGTYFMENGLTSYYLAKFSTKYNMTEYFVLSEDIETMEQVKGVKVDVEQEKVFLAVEINKNKYHGRTVYAPGAEPGIDNSNVAIMAYSWRFATREWITVCGNEKYLDKYGEMVSWGNFIYVFINSFSTEYSTNATQTDIYYYRMRIENGFVESQVIWGSPTDDFVYDVEVNYQGIFFLAEMGHNLLPHRDGDKAWGGQNGKSSWVLAWLDFNDKILEMEGYAFDEMVDPFPTKFFIARTDDHNQTYVFASHRSNDIVDHKGGIFLT